MTEIKFTLRAYAKLFVHVLKYPHCQVNGVLIAKIQKDRDQVLFVDAVPLFHILPGLSPMYEIALQQISSFCDKNGFVIGGYYQANEHYKDKSPDYVAKQVCDKIHSIYGSVHLFMVDSGLISDKMTTPGLNVFQTSSSGHWEKSNSELSNRVAEDDDNGSSLQLSHVAQCLLPLMIEGAGSHGQTATPSISNLVDFDSHLDDLSGDWRNIRWNKTLQHIAF